MKRRFFPVFLASACAAALLPLSAQTSWDTDADGDWFTAGNWTAGIPDASGAEARFDFDLTADRTVTLNQTAIVGEIVFDSDFSTIITGSGSLDFQGGATLTPTNGDANLIEVDIATGSQSLVIDGGGAGRSLTLAGTITGTGGLNKFPELSTLEVLADNSGWSGGIAGRGGRLGIGHDNALGTGDVSLRGGVEYYAIGGDRTLDNALDGTTTQANWFDGANGNNFTFTGNGIAGQVGHINGGTLTFTGDVEVGNINPRAGVNGVMRFEGSVSSTSARTIDGALTAASFAGRVEFLGDNWDPVAEEGLIINEIRDGAIVGVGHDRALGDPDRRIVTVRNAAIEALGGDRSIANDFGIHTVNAGRGLHFIGDDHNITVTGDLENRASNQTGGLFKDGDHTLTLEGDLSYTLDTQVLGGTLIINGDASNATGDVTVASGATLGGSTTIGGTTTIQGGGTIAPGNSTGTLTFADGLTLEENSILSFDLGPTSDLILVTGGTFSSSQTVWVDLNFLDGATTGTYDLLDVSGISEVLNNEHFDLGNVPDGFVGTLQIGGLFDILQVDVQVIPEPRVYALLVGMLALGLALIRRRRKTA